MLTSFKSLQRKCSHSNATFNQNGVQVQFWFLLCGILFLAGPTTISRQKALEKLLKLGKKDEDFKF